MLKFIFGLIIGIVLGIVLSYTPTTNHYIQPYGDYADVSEIIGK